MGVLEWRSGDNAARPCPCVLRKIFRICYGRFRACVSGKGEIRQVKLEHVGSGAKAKRIFGRKDQEFCADFCAVAKRALTEEEHRIFRFHFLLGADWRLCCRRLRIERGAFFHQLYDIEQKLGRVFRELQPYALFPLDEYFGGSVPGRDITMMPSPRRIDTAAPLRPPLRSPLKAA
jgi:hypothetical protein